MSLINPIFCSFLVDRVWNWSENIWNNKSTGNTKRRRNDGTRNSRKNDHHKTDRRTVPGKLVRKPQIALDVELNALLINCRSLPPKLTSLAENFKTNKATLALLTETWFSKGNKKVAHGLNILSQRDNISFIRKDRNTRGGGVAIAFNSSKIEVKKMPLTSLAKSPFEILVGKGKMIGVKKCHIVVACYIPPSYNSRQNKEFFDALTDAISEARSAVPDAWITIGGDWNGRSLGDISKLFPDLVEIPSPPHVRTPRWI